MEEEEAKKYGFRLSRVVSITSLLDELKSKDSEAWDSTKTLESWVNEPVAEEAHEEDDKADHLERKAEHKTVNKHRATLNFSTASFAVRFLKARHAKLSKKAYDESEKYKNNDVLPSNIPVDIYLESLKSLKSQKEHRKVDLFKELRKKKAIKRRDESFRKTISRLKHRQSSGKERVDIPSSIPHATSCRKSKMKKTYSKTGSEAIFEVHVDDFSPPRAAVQSPAAGRKGRSAIVARGEKTKKISSAPAPFGSPVVSRPISSAKTGNAMSRVAIGSGDDDYNRQLEATLSDMIYTYDRTFGFDENESRQDTTDIASAAAAAKKPFGTPLASRPLCGIYSSHS